MSSAFREQLAAELASEEQDVAVHRAELYGGGLLPPREYALRSWIDRADERIAVLSRILRLYDQTQRAQPCRR